MSEDRDRGAAWEARKALLRRGVRAGLLRDHHPVGRAALPTAMEWAAAHCSSLMRDGRLTFLHPA